MNLVVHRKKLLDVGLFNVLKALSVIMSMLIVVVSYKLFSFEIYSGIQSDYALYAFVVLIFNIGLNPVSQIIGNSKKNLLNEFKLVVVIYIFSLLLLNLVVPKKIFINIISFNEFNKCLIYGWPLLLVQNIISFYFLGQKNYLFHFLTPTINNLLIFIGVLLFYITDNYNLIFFLPLIFSLIICFSLVVDISFKSINKRSLFVISHLWKSNILPVLSSFVGIKNINYFIITFVGSSFFGIYKMAITIFNPLNFFLSTKMTIISNDALREGKKILSNMHKISALKKIYLLSNLAFCALLYVINNYVYRFYELSFVFIICFSLINILSNIYKLDNSVMFVAKKNSLRVYSDIAIFCGMTLCFIAIPRYFSFSELQIMYVIVVLYLINYLVSNFFYYFKNKYQHESYD
jgi:hypothetical protein